MSNSRTLTLISLALLASVALSTICEAKQSNEQSQNSGSLASRLGLPQTKARTSRSLSDMFEKVRSKIFGSRKQANPVGPIGAASSVSSQIQPASSVNMGQRQPWAELNSFNQQYSPYSNYQWPSAGSQSGSQYLAGQQFGPMGSAFSSAVNSGFGGALVPGMDGQQVPAGVQSGPASPVGGSAAGPSGSGSNGLISSASHLIAQYLSPNSGSSASGSAAVPSQQQPQQQQSQLGPAQQQQSQYNEFASILDSMVAQTGMGSPQRQPASSQQYMSSANGGPIGQAGQSAPNYPTAPGDNEMSGSSNIQSYLPAGQPAPAGQKSSMVSLAEQLAPGAQFNKLVSFPFSLSNNEDPSKEGRYKLHIPFLNQHVKRSDQQQQVGSAAAAAASQQLQQQRQAQQYLNSYYSQQQYAAALANQQQQQQQQQLLAQSSQVLPIIMSPQSALAGSVVQASQQVASGAQSVASASATAQSASPTSGISSLSSQSSVTALHSPPSNPSSASSAISSQQQQPNGRPAWSVADLQSGGQSSSASSSSSSSSSSSAASSSKLIPIQSSASSSLSADSSSVSRN